MTAAHQPVVGASPKVVHLVAGDLEGGAARGALWLHQSLCRIGLDSTLLGDGAERPGDATVRSLLHSPLPVLAHKVARRLESWPVLRYPRRLRRIFSTGRHGLDWANDEAVRRADLVHLHWVNGLVSVESLARLGKPVVWTLRDMWPFTGGCHYAMGCERFRHGCGACPQLGSPREEDLSRQIVHRKQRCYPAGLVPVAISSWLADMAQASSLFQGRVIETIPNGLDTGRFAPMPASEARHRLGLAVDVPIVMFAAQQVGDFYKGFDHLRSALQALAATTASGQPTPHLLVVGRASPLLLQRLPLPHTALGFVADDERMRLAYAAADVFVAPSVMEAFGKSLAEAQACGTPVVCFDATGPRDIVDHRVTGYRATAFDAEDLARGIRWVLDLPAQELAGLRTGSRQRAVAQFDGLVVARRYQALYRRVLGAGRPT